MNNNDIILDPEGWIALGQTVRIPFEVAESDIEITGVILALATFVLDFALETPDGDVIGETFAAGDPSVAFRRSQQSMHMRASLPVLVAGRPVHQGRWHLVLKVDRRKFQKYLRWWAIFRMHCRARSPMG